MNFLILVVSIITLITSGYLFGLAGGSISLRKFNSTTFVFVFSILISTYIGATLSALGLVNFHYMISPASPETKISAFFWVCYSVIIIPLTMIFVNNSLGIKNMPKLFNEFISKPTVNTFSNNTISIINLVMIIFSLFTIIYIFYYSGASPIIKAIEGDFESAASERNMTKRGFGGIIYIKNLAGFYLLPIFSYFSYFQFINNKRFLNFIGFLVLFLINIALLIYDIQKAPIVLYLMGLLVINVLVKGEVSRATIVKVFLSLFFILIIGYTITTGRDISSFLSYKSSFFTRLTLSSYGGYLLSMEWFPNEITTSTWFVGIPSLFLNIFNVEPIESARLVMTKLNPEGVENGTAGIASSYFLAEAWANFGYLGLIISPIIIGIVVQVLQLFLVLSKKDPMILSFYAFISTHWLIQNGFSNFLYLKQLIFPFILYVMVKIIMNSLPKSKYERSTYN